MLTPRIQVPFDRLAEFCRRRGVAELALFGSVLRDDFGPSSDVDVLVSLRPGSAVSLLGFVGMQRELSLILGRRVDLVLKDAVAARPQDPRGRRIVETARVLYAA